MSNILEKVHTDIYKPLNLKNLQNKKRLTVSTEEALKDVIPIEWDNDVINGNKEVLLVEKNVERWYSLNKDFEFYEETLDDLLNIPLYGDEEYFIEVKDIQDGVKLTPVFIKSWRNIPATNRSLKDLKKHLQKSPNAGDVIKPKGKHKMMGARKLSWSSGKGNSYDVRVIYAYIHKLKCIYLLYSYPKNVQEDLDVDLEKMIIRMIIDLESRKESE